VTLTPTLEFRLIADCCSRFGRASEFIEPPLPLLDWDRFLRLARFHRVQGLVWEALAPLSAHIPCHVSPLLAADATDIAADNLRAAVECAELRDEFAAAGVPLLFVKGLTVGALAYGRSSIKSSSDIDLLIPDSELDRSTALLLQRGYAPVIPQGAGSSALHRWHQVRKESVWQKVGPGLEVDLHTRLADSRRLIPGIGIASPTQLVEIAPAIELPTLGNDELFAYLAVHGASSAWFRLKWITDLAALVARNPSAEIERLYRRSQQLGAGRAAAQALLLADHLFGTLADVPDLRRELGADRASRWLARTAFRQLAGAPEPVDPTSAPFGTLAIHATQFLLLPGVAFKASELVRQVRYHFA
jgi:hypothetical protein